MADTIQTDTLTDKEREYLLALVSTRTREEAAGRLDVTARAVSAFLAEHPAVMEAYREARKDTIRMVAAELTADCAEALRELRAIVIDKEAQRGERLTAIRMTLEFAARFHEMDALQDEVQTIKAVLKENGLTP